VIFNQMRKNDDNARPDLTTDCSIAQFDPWMLIHYLQDSTEHCSYPCHEYESNFCA